MKTASRTYAATTTENNLSESESGARTIRKVLPYLWPEGMVGIKIRVCLAMIVLIASKVMTVYAPTLYAQAVDILSNKGLSDLALGAVGLTAAYGLARLMAGGFQHLRDVLFARVAQNALRALALETFRHIHRLPMSYHITRKTGGLSRIIERGVKGIEFLLRFLLFSIVPLILELLMVGAMLAWYFGWSYVLVVALTILFYVIFTLKVTEWRVQLRKQMNHHDTDANQKAVDSLLNFETVKYFGAEEREARRYDHAMAGYEKAALKTAYSLGFLNFGQLFLITAGLMIVMMMAAVEVQNGTLSVGDFVLINAYMIQITMPLNFLGSVYREIRQALVDMGEMFALLERTPDVQDAPGAPALQVRAGQITLRDVHFGYDPARPILRGIDLTITAGQVSAIVGTTGSGKSTIGRLLFRFYDVNKGAIEIDGQDIRSVTQASVHAAIGVVPQDTVLFNDTISYNIAYGRDDASQEQIITAARAAQLHDFITALPEGYATQVGERGLKLSGGEKQRVGIARTLLKNPPILLLDEATSALDTTTETDVQNALHAAAQGRTVITIAHRLSTISGADQIIVLEKGKVIEHGNHGDLIAAGGRYAQLWEGQKDQTPV